MDKSVDNDDWQIDDDDDDADGARPGTIQRDRN